MNEQLLVVNEFLSPAHRAKITDTALRCGVALRFCETEEAAAPHLADCTLLFSHFPSLPPQAPRLKWYCCAFAGIDPYQKEGALPEGCLLSNSSGAYGVTIAEHLLMVVLTLLRRQMDYNALMARREWVDDLPIRSLYGSTVTVLGTGDIGGNFARRVKAMGAARIVGVNRSGRCGESAFDQILDQTHLNDILPETDVLVMAMPSTPETAGLLSRERLALLPATAVVANVGRGSAVDQEALVEALNSGRLAGAALDVMVPEPLPQEHPLWTAKNCLLTPHVSGNMTLGYTCDRVVDMFCEDLENFAAGRPLRHLADPKRGY